MSAQVQILRVNGVRSREPVVIAMVDDQFVRWSPRDGWTCDCPVEVDTDSCAHVDAIDALLDPRVIGATP